MILFLLFGLGVFLIVYAFTGNRPESKQQGKQLLPYYKKQYLLTSAEFSFFKVLEHATGNQYYLFPQVRLTSLVRTSAHGREWWFYFHKISQKSVDFVLAEKATCKPLLVIELDDSSHDEEERQERDEFCNQVFQSANIPVLHIDVSHGYQAAQLKKEIEEVLLNGLVSTNQDFTKQF